jgi:hypothetical protein
MDIPRFAPGRYLTTCFPSVVKCVEFQWPCRLFERLPSASPDEKVVRVSDFQSGTGDIAFYTRIYEIPSTSESQFSPALHKIKIDQLKLSATDLGGTLFLVGDEVYRSGDIHLLTEIAPQLHFCVVPVDTKFYRGDVEVRDVYIWRAGIDKFLEALSVYVTRAISSEVMDLKDARSLPVPRSLIAEVGEDWTLLTSKHIMRSGIAQPQFDQFLNGEPEWPVYVAKGAYLRNLIDSLLSSCGGKKFLRGNTYDNT